MIHSSVTDKKLRYLNNSMFKKISIELQSFSCHHYYLKMSLHQPYGCHEECNEGQSLLDVSYLSQIYCIYFLTLIENFFSKFTWVQQLLVQFNVK